MIVHGWPELSISWRHQLPVFAAWAFAASPRTCAAMAAPASTRATRISRRSTARHDRVAGSLGREKAVFVGHDWGSPVVWSLASHHPERSASPTSACPTSRRASRSKPSSRWSTARSIPRPSTRPASGTTALLRGELRQGVHGLRGQHRRRREGAVPRRQPGGDGQPGRTAAVRKNGGWFGGAGAPDLPRDRDVITEQDSRRLRRGAQAQRLLRPGQLVHERRGQHRLRREAQNGGQIELPVLFLHGAYDWVCETDHSRLAEPMRAACSDLTEARPTPATGWPRRSPPWSMPRWRVAGDEAAGILGGLVDAPGFDRSLVGRKLGVGSVGVGAKYQAACQGRRTCAGFAVADAQHGLCRSVIVTPSTPTIATKSLRRRRRTDA